MWVDMARIVAAAAGNRVLILPILPAADEPADGTPNPNVPGEAYHLRSARAAANARTEALFPTAIARDAAGRTLLKRLQDSGNGSAGDNADIAAGLTPRSLRSDALHLNAAGDAVVFAFVKEALARQPLPSLVTQATVFTLTAMGANPRTGMEVRDTAYAVVRRGVVADLAQAIDGALTSSAYYPTLAEAVSDLGIGEYFNSDDQAAVGPHPDVKWIYKRTGADPFYEAIRRWGRPSDVGLGAYPDSPTALPVSVDQAAAIAAAVPPPRTVSAATTAAPNERIAADTSAGSFTITLPIEGGTVTISDAAGTWGDHALTIDGNSRTIDGNPTFSADASGFQLVFTSVGAAWRYTLTFLRGA